VIEERRGPMKVHLGGILLLALAGTSQADIYINFDNLADGTNVGNNYAGMTFTNALVQAQGISLSPIFTPASAPNVAVNLPGGTMTIAFTTGIPYFQAHFTYIEPLSLVFMDGGATLDTVDSEFDCNDLFSISLNSCTDGSTDVGPAPNELISYAAVDGNVITSVSITSASGLSDTFTIDNISSVPEPSSLFLLVNAALLVAVILRKKRRSVRESGGMT
jgi:hypothetical protein